MNNYDFNVIAEKTLSLVNGGQSEFSGGGSNPAGGGSDAEVFRLWELMDKFGRIINSVIVFYLLILSTEIHNYNIFAS